VADYLTRYLLIGPVALRPHRLPQRLGIPVAR